METSGIRYPSGIIDGYFFACDFDIESFSYIFVVSKDHKYVKYKIPDHIIHEVKDDWELYCANLIRSMILELKEGVIECLN